MRGNDYPDQHDYYDQPDDAAEIQHTPAEHKTVHHAWVPSEPRLRVKLERGQKGTYAWDITFESESLTELLVRIQEADRMLRERYVEGAS